MAENIVKFWHDTHYYEGEKVNFTKTGLKIAGLLFYPADFDKNKKYPAVVVVHPGNGAKEQVASLYSWHLAQKGFVALAFDASHQGESEGVPRYLEDPFSRVEDVRAAVDYLTTLPFTDNEKIGALGICAGGGYALCAIQTDLRIKAAAGISSWNVGAWIRDGIPSKGYCAEMQQALARAADARTKEANGEEPLYMGYVPNSPAEFTDETPQIMKEACEYYMTPRCAYPTSVNKMLVQSLDRLASFDAFQYIGTVAPRPLLFIVGSRADTKYFSDDAYARANEPKEMFIIDNASHIDLYDKPEFVTQAAAKLVDFFGTYLK